MGERRLAAELWVECPMMGHFEVSEIDSLNRAGFAGDLQLE
jgi:hypothetical protein